MTRCLRQEAVGVLLLTLVGALLRFWQLGAQSLWLDELFSVMVARRGLADVLVGTLQGDTNPPLYNLLLHFALQFGSDETAARFLSALFSTATIPLFYLFARRLFASRRVATAAALLLVVSPFQIAYAQEARMYAQLAFFQLAGAFFLLRAWHGNRLRDWLLFAVAEALALYSHSLAGLALISLDLLVLIHWQTLKAQWRSVVGAHLLIGVLFAPWAWGYSQQATRVLTGFWNPASNALNLARTAYVLVMNSALPTVLVPIGLMVILFLFVLAVYTAARQFFVKSSDVHDRFALQWALSLTLVPPLILFLISFVRPVYIERVVGVSALGLILLWAWVWARGRLFEHIMIGVMAVLIVIALGNYYAHPELQKPPMREAAQKLAAAWQPGDLVMHTGDWAALAFDYYLPNIPQHFLAGDPEYANPTTRRNSGLVAGLAPEEAPALLANHPRTWLVVALSNSAEYQRQRLSEFSARYPQLQQIEVERIYLYLFDTADGNGPHN